MSNLQSDFIDTINRLHNEDCLKQDDPYIMAETPNQIHVKCKLSKCPYMLQFEFESKNIDRSRDKKSQFDEPHKLTVQKLCCNFHDEGLHNKVDEHSSDSEQEAEEDAAVPEAKEAEGNLDMDWLRELSCII